jgi:hypothetical protein
MKHVAGALFWRLPTTDDYLCEVASNLRSGDKLSYANVTPQLVPGRGGARRKHET